MNRWIQLSMLLIPAIGLLACGLCFLHWLETKLVYPAPRGGVAVAAEHGAEEQFICSTDGTRVHAWFYSVPDATHTIVFFHGNGESIEFSGPWAGSLAKALNANVMMFDYRGYGRSEGKPFERGVVQDGISVVDWVAARLNVPTQQLVYVGRSLGGGVAAQVAISRPPKALVMLSTFSSLIDVAGEVMPRMPFRLIMKNQYESSKALSRMDMPLLVVHGDSDRLVPLKLAKKMFEAAGSDRKQIRVLPGKGHNDLGMDDFLPAVNGFLEEVSAIENLGQRR